MFDLTIRDSDTALPAGFVHVVAVFNPFSDDHRAVTEIPAGSSIAEILAMFTDRDDVVEHISAFVNGDYIPPHWWARVRPKAGATLLLKAVPGIGALIGVLAPIAGTFGASALGLTAGTLGFQLVAAAISFGVLAIGQALFGPSQPEQVGQGPPTFSISGARNRANRFGAVPVVLGTHRYVPPYGGVPYTETDGINQFLRFVIIWGYGPVDVQDIRIGNTPLSSFQNVLADHDFDGTASVLGLYPRDASQEALNVRLTTSFQERRTPIEVDEIGITISFPNGLIGFQDDGDAESRQQFITAQYRRVGTSTWVTFVNGFRTLQRTRRPFKIAFSATGLTRGQYDVRVLRSPPELQDADPQEFDRSIWTALRAFDNTQQPVELSGIAKSAFRIRANDQLNGVIDQLNAVVSTKIPTWDGSAWGGQNVTSNPAAIFRYVLTGTPNPRPVAAANVDHAGLGAWYETCEAEGYKFDQPIDFRRPVRDLLQDVAAAGFASPAYIDDQWTVIEEKARSTVVQHFTPRNTRNFEGALLFPTIPQALRCRFVNAQKDYIEDERIVYDDGFDASSAELFQVIDLPGQTDPGNVYRLGRHFLASARLRPEIFTFEVDVEHLVATRGDLCRLTHDAPIIGQQSGRIRAVSETQVTLDEPVDLVSGQQYRLRVRTSSGGDEALDFVATSSATDVTALPIAGAAGTIAAGELYLFGLAGIESLEVLISGIEYLDNLAARVTCVPYSPEIYDAGDAIPPYETNLSDRRAASFEGPPDPVIDEIVTDEDALFRTAAGDLQPRILVYARPGVGAIGAAYTTPTAFFQARFRPTGSSDPYVYTPSIPADTDFIEISDVETGDGYDIQIRAIDATGGVSNWVSESNVQVLGASLKPPTIASFGINTISDHTYVEWTYQPPIDVVGYEIRYHPDQGVTEWFRMGTLSDEVPRQARSFTVPSRTGTYAIKAIDVLGNKSQTALFIDASLEDPAELNVVQAIVEDPGFTGALDSVIVNPETGYLQLASGSVMADWDTLEDVTSLSYGAGASQGFELEGTYEFGETDLGSVQTSRIFANLNLNIIATVDVMSAWGTLSVIDPIAGDATSDDVRVTLEVAYSLDDVAANPTYTEWRRFVVGDYTARWLKFRAKLETFEASQSPEVRELAVTIDMPDEIRRGSDISSGAGTFDVTFSPAFFELSTVQINAQDLQQGDYWEISGKTRTGFSITFRDSGGTAVDRTFDYQAIGWGRERGT